jgi:PKD repeat protein
MMGSLVRWSCGVNRPSLTSASIVVSLALTLGAAAPAAAAPTADFTISPTPVIAGEVATLTSTSTTTAGQQIVSTEWDFNSDGTFDANGVTVTHTFPTAGPANVTLRVTDSAQETLTSMRQVTVVGPPPPVADFTVAPAVPVAGSTATFTSTSSAGQGASITSVQWDFENDGTIEATGAVANHVFATGGAHFVRVHVVDSRNLSADAIRQVTVNAPPIAAFTAFPTVPVVGDEVSLTSYSSDAEGALAAQQWDLDADGDFDDASGAVVTGMFTSPGDHTLRLRVRDNQGATATVSKTITVLAPPRNDPPPKKDDPPPTKSDGTPPASAPAFVALVSPFPIVRLVGAVVKGGARIKMLAVRAPAGSRVYVNCRGAGCPARRYTKVVGASPVRFRALERFLPKGSVIEILVRKGNQIGKYTSFLIRRNRVPKRVDGCLPPYASRAMKCPAD